MWVYRRRLTIHPREVLVTFAETTLLIGASGRVLTEVSDDLADKMRNAPHIFTFDASLPPLEKTEIKRDNVKPKRKRRTKTQKGDKIAP